MIKNIPFKASNRTDSKNFHRIANEDIVSDEKAKIDLNNAEDLKIINASNHMNPVEPDGSIFFSMQKQKNRLSDFSLPKAEALRQGSNNSKISPQVLRAFISPGQKFLDDKSTAFSTKRPFVFFNHASPHDVQSESASLAAVSPYYDSIDRNNISGEARNKEIFYVSRFDSKVHSLGLLEDIVSDKQPLAYHLLMINNDVLLPDVIDKEEYNESVAAVAVFFELGLYVEKNFKQTVSLIDILDQEEQSAAFGGLFLEAIGEGLHDVAMVCIDHGVVLNSRDRDGQLALFAALRPGFEKVLDHLLNAAANKWSVNALREILNPTDDWDKKLLENLTSKTIEIIESHIERLSV